LLHRRYFSLIVLLDSDSGSAPIEGASFSSPIPKAIPVLDRHIIDRSYTLSPSLVTPADLEALATTVNGKVTDNRLSIDGIEFSLNSIAEERFLDDLRRAQAIVPKLSDLEAIRPEGAVVQLSLASTSRLSREKRSLARRLLAQAVYSAASELADRHSFIVSVIETDISAFPRLPLPPRDPSRLSTSLDVVTSRYLQPIQRIDFRKRHSLAAKHMLGADPTEVGKPRAVVGDALFHLEFWTIILLVILLAWVSAEMWNIKVDQDPEIYYTGYIPDPDSSVMDGF
jgi:hypothetical protein